MENFLRQTLYGDSETPSAGIAGIAQNDEPHSVEQLVHQQRYGIRVPSAGDRASSSPAKPKAMSIDEIEKALAERRKARRVSFAEQNVDFLKGARETIQTFCKEHRGEIVAAGSFEKLFG